MSLVIAGVVVVSISGLVLRVLRGPLLAMLAEACGLDHRARFWWRVSAAELVVGTALCASTALVVTGLTADPWLTAVAVLRGGCVGLLVSMAAITAGALAVGRAAGVGLGSGQ